MAEGFIGTTVSGIGIKVPDVVFVGWGVGVVVGVGKMGGTR